MLHSKKKIKKKADQREYTPHGNFFKTFPCNQRFGTNKNRLRQNKNQKPLTPRSRKEKIMRTVLFAYYLNNERKHEALYTEQRLDFMRSYKIRKRRKTVSDVEGCLV